MSASSSPAQGSSFPSSPEKEPASFVPLQQELQTAEYYEKEGQRGNRRFSMFEFFSAKRDTIRNTLLVTMKPLLEKKLELRRKRRDKLMAGTRGKVSSFDVYNINAAQYDSLDSTSICGLISFFVSQYRMKMPSESSKSDLPPEPRQILVPYTNQDEDTTLYTNPAFKAAAGEPFSPVSFLVEMPSVSVDSGQLDLDNVVAYSIASEDLPKGLLQLALRLLVELHEHFRTVNTATQALQQREALYKLWNTRLAAFGASLPPLARKSARSSGRRAANGLPDDANTVNEWINHLLLFAARRYATVGVKPSEHKDEGSKTIQQEDDVINPSVVDVSALENKLRDWKVQPQREAMVDQAVNDFLQVMEDFDRNVIGRYEIKRRLIEIFSSAIQAPIVFILYPSHMVLQGGAGTGKTTVATYIQRAFTALGIFESTIPAVIDRSSLVAPYEGQTVTKTRNFLLQRLFENVGFFDEAYQLVNGPGDSYGLEALTSLFQFLNDYPECVLLIAGYASQINESLFSNNEGLARRFRTTLNFGIYTPDEMMDIMGVALTRLVKDNIVVGVADVARFACYYIVQRASSMAELMDQASRLKDAVQRIYGPSVDVTDEFMRGEEKKTYFLLLQAEALPFGSYAGDINNFAQLIFDQAATRAANNSVRAISMPFKTLEPEFAPDGKIRYIERMATFKPQEFNVRAIAVIPKPGALYILPYDVNNAHVTHLNQKRIRFETKVVAEMRNRSQRN